MLIMKMKEWYHSDEYNRLFKELGTLAANLSIQAPDGYCYDPLYPYDWKIAEGFRLFRDRVTGARVLFPCSLFVHPLEIHEAYDKNRMQGERMQKKLWESAK